MLRVILAIRAIIAALTALTILTVIYLLGDHNGAEREDAACATRNAQAVVAMHKQKESALASQASKWAQAYADLNAQKLEAEDAAAASHAEAAQVRPGPDCRFGPDAMRALMAARPRGGK